MYESLMLAIALSSRVLQNVLVSIYTTIVAPKVPQQRSIYFDYNVKKLAENIYTHIHVIISNAGFSQCSIDYFVLNMNLQILLSQYNNVTYYNSITLLKILFSPPGDITIKNFIGARGLKHGSTVEVSHAALQTCNVFQSMLDY